MASQPEAGGLTGLDGAGNGEGSALSPTEILRHIRGVKILGIFLFRDERQATRPLSVVMAEGVSAMRQWAGDRTVSAGELARGIQTDTCRLAAVNPVSIRLPSDKEPRKRSTPP